MPIAVHVPILQCASPPLLLAEPALSAIPGVYPFLKAFQHPTDRRWASESVLRKEVIGRHVLSEQQDASSNSQMFRERLMNGKSLPLLETKCFRSTVADEVSDSHPVSYQHDTHDARISDHGTMLQSSKGGLCMSRRVRIDRFGCMLSRAVPPIASVGTVSRGVAMCQS